MSIIIPLSLVSNETVSDNDCTADVNIIDFGNSSCLNYTGFVRSGTDTLDIYKIHITEDTNLTYSLTNTYSPAKNMVYSYTDTCVESPSNDLTGINANIAGTEDLTSGNYKYIAISTSVSNKDITYSLELTSPDCNAGYEAGSLLISKTATDNVVEYNQTIQYVITIANESKGDASDVTVVDILPNEENLTNFTITDDGGFNCTLHTNNQDYTIANLPIDLTPPSTLTCTDGEVDGRNGNSGVPGITRIYYKVNAPNDTLVLENTATVTDSEGGTSSSYMTVTVLGDDGSGYIPPPPEHADIIDTFTNASDYNDGTSQVIQTKIAAEEFISIAAVHLNASNTATPYVHSDPDFSFLVIPYLSNSTCTEQRIVYDSNTNLPLVMNIPVNTVSVSGDMDVAAFVRKDARFLVTYLDLGALFDDTGVKCLYSSSTTGNLAGLGQCVNSANNYYDAFGLTAFERCNVLNGQPCESSNGGYSCGPPNKPDTTSCPNYNPIYDNELGCLMCTLNIFPECSSDNFAIRPKNFDVNITDGDTFTAGKLENLLFRAPNDKDMTPINIPNEPDYGYNEVQNTSFRVDLNVSDSDGCQIKNLTLSPLVNFTNGEHQDNFSFDDIGDINMSIHEVNGTEFALVDAYDTNDTQRFIKEFNASIRVIPDHFNIDVNLTDHNSDNNFTYLHDINTYDSDDNYKMGSNLNISIKALGADGNITRNYTETCYAKDSNLSLDIDDINITYPSLTPALTQFLYYNPNENNGTAGSGEGNYSLAPLTDVANMSIFIPSLPIENSTVTFPSDGPEDNGTASFEYKLNFDRKINLVVNPFKIVINDVNITDTDDVYGEDTLLDQNSTTLHYARTRASQFFYDDVTDLSKQTPIAIDVYCDLGYTICPDVGIDTANAQTPDLNWWLSLGHDTNTFEDGNVTLQVGALIEGTGAPSITSGTTTDPANVRINAGGIQSNVTVTANAVTVPMTVPIELVNRTEVLSPGYGMFASPYTNHWLIYNKYSATDVPSPFYKVRFIGVDDWAGKGPTGWVVDDDASTKKNNRLGW